MKYLKQLSIILVVLFFAEGLHALLPFPIPASIYGLVLLLICLCTGVIKLSWVEETADWLVAIMPICFVPASVGLIDEWPVLKPFIVPLAAMCVVSTVAIFGVSGRVTQALIRARRRKEQDHD